MACNLVYHNPGCSKSRGALEILRERDVEFDVVEYLKAPPDRLTLERILAIDGDPTTHWHTRWGDDEPRHPHELVIDMGKQHELSGFSYLPRQGSRNGRIKDYKFYVSRDGKDWGKPVSAGRFPNGQRRQRRMFEATVTGRYLRLVATSEVRNRAWTSVAELDVIARPKKKPTPKKN